MKKLLWKLLSVLFVCVGCASYPVPDVEFYKEMPFTGRGLGVHTVSDKSRIIPKEEFDKLKPYLLCTGPEGYAEIKKAWYKGCIYAQKRGECERNVETFDEWLTSLDNIFKEVIKSTKR